MSGALERGIHLLGKGDIVNATLEFQSAVQEAPASEDAHSCFALCLMRQRRNDEAEQVIHQFLQTSPTSYECLILLAEIKRGRSDLEGAIATCQKAIAIEPNRAEAHGILGSCYLKKFDAKHAIEHLKLATQIAPDVEPYHHYLGAAYSIEMKTLLMENELSQAMRLDPRNVQNYLVLGSHYLRMGIVGKALDAVMSGLRKMPKSGQLHELAAIALTMIKQDEEAEVHYKKAIEDKPDLKPSFGLWLIDQGRFEEAKSIFQATVAQKPQLAIGYYGLLQCQKGAASESLKEPMMKIACDLNTSLINKMYASYGMGKLTEQEGDYQSAFRYYDQANEAAFILHSHNAPFSLERIRSDRDLIIKKYESLKSQKIEGMESARPIFIVGMIRSGTTLLDQIVSSHPLVASAGELRFWIEKSIGLVAKPEENDREILRKVAVEYEEYVSLLSKGKPFHTDKMPLYFSYLGLIHLALPHARFLHIQRDPADTCLSIFTTYFGGGSQFVYNRSNTAEYYKEYLKFMEYWRRHLPAENLLELHYEDLVLNKEATVRNVIEFCGLSWDEACLHHEKNTSAINTPSRWQARQPVYTSSIGRWKNYKDWIPEFVSLRQEGISSS